MHECLNKDSRTTGVVRYFPDFYTKNSSMGTIVVVSMLLFLVGYVLVPLVIGYLLEKNWENLTFAKAVLIFIVGGTSLIDFCSSFSMAYFMGNSWLNGLKMTLAVVLLDTVKAILAAWIT